MVWNQERVDEFMQHVATGFVPPSPLELALQLCALFAVIFAYVFVYRRIQRLRRQARERYSAERYFAYCQELRLGASDRELLDRLSLYLANPPEEQHTLLRDRDSFHGCLDALLATEYRPVEAPGAARPFQALGVRLGFPPRVSGRRLRGTTDLPPGTILHGEDGTALFRIVRVEPAHLEVACLAGLPGELRRAPRRTRLNFRRREGLYEFDTELIASTDATAILSHNRGALRRRQNRRHFRREWRVPVRLGGIDGYTVDLSGGGALIELAAPSPQQDGSAWRPGDRHELMIEGISDPLNRNRATVIVAEARLIAANSTMHPEANANRNESTNLMIGASRWRVEFVRLRETDRDRIVRELFGAESRSLREASRSVGQVVLVSMITLFALTGFSGKLEATPESGSGGTPTQQNDERDGQSPDSMSSSTLADRYYSRGKYDLARIEYDRLLLLSEDQPDPAAARLDPIALRARLGLSLMRTAQYRESLRYLNDRRDFRHLYLSMYAAFRAGWVLQGLGAQSRILDSREITDQQKDAARLLGGTVYLESGEYDRVRGYYTNLHREAVDDSVRVMAGKLLTSLDDYESLDRKNAWLAATFSALLPGAGQVYAGHTVDGVTAFFFNGMFLGSALIMYDLENRSGSSNIGSGIFGVIGLVFYLSNITGAWQTAERYNAYQERQFHQAVRDAFFHLDYIEKNSGVVFQTDF